jgi:dienelactone hydrolase
LCTMNKNARTFFLCGIVLVLLGGLISYLLSFRDVRIEHITLLGEQGDRIRATVHIPLRGKPPYPAVISLHSIFQEERIVRPLALDCARNNLVVLVIHFDGYSQIQRRHKNLQDYCSEIQAAIAYLRGRGDVAPMRISLMGHSIGANLACMVASKDPTLLSTIALGFNVQADRRSISNLLLAIGILDELHPVSEMEASYREASGDKKAHYGVRIENQADRHNCALFVAPLSDHHCEIFDPFFYREAVTWMGRAAGEPLSPPIIREPFAIIFYALFLVGATMLFFTAFLSLTPLRRNLFGKEGRGNSFLYNASLSFLILPLILIMELTARYLDRGVVHDMAFLAFAALMAVNGCSRRFRETPDFPLFIREMKKSALDLFVLWGALYTGIIVNRIENLAALPGYIPLIPVAALFSIPIDIFYFVTKSGAFVLGSGSHSPCIIFPLMAALECLFPGLVFHGAAEFISRMLSFMKSFRLKLSVRTSPASFVLLCITIIAAIIVWRQILSEGYDFSLESVKGFASLFFRLVLLPLIIAFLAFRSMWYVRLHALYSKPLPQEVREP